MATQDRFSKIVEAKLRSESIFAGLFNRRYEGTPTAGAVKIPVRAEATVGTYSIANGGDLANPETTFATLNIDQDIYVNELIDGYVAASVPDGLIADRLDSAGYAIADKIDVTLASTAATKGTAFTPASTNTTTYAIITEAIQKLKKAKVKPSEMWLAVSNDYAFEVINDSNFIAASNLGDDVKQNGILGRISGVNVYESCNLPDGVNFILGNSVYCHYVDEWAVNVATKDLADGKHIGAAAVQGRKVYGTDVTKPATVLVYKTSSKG